MRKNLLCILLAALMTTSSISMISCENSAENNAAETNSTKVKTTNSADNAESEEETLTDYERRQLIPDDLPDKKFDGMSFRVLTADTDAYRAEIIADEMTGDVCNDAVYNRNLKVEDRFDTKILYEGNKEPHNAIGNFVTAGTEDYQIAGFFDYLAFTPIEAGALLNWLDVPNVNLDKPWHNKLANDEATINNILYAICSDMSITSMTFTHAIFANLDLAGNYGYEKDDLYSLVNEGKWTIDKLIEITSDIYYDENGNGRSDPNDLHGFGYELSNPADVWFTAFGGKVATKDENGDIIVTFMNDKTVEMLDKLLNWHYNTEGFVKLSGGYAGETYFRDDKLVFAPMRFAAAYSTLREKESPYTMLPYPKWDEEQEAYYTNADDKFTVFGVPLTSVNSIDFVGTIFEALCAESYKSVYPAYYDLALKNKYSTDPTTAEIVDLIMAGRRFDFSFQFSRTYFQRICYLMRDMLNQNNPNIASAYKKVEKLVNKAMSTKFRTIYKMDE